MGVVCRGYFKTEEGVCCGGKEVHCVQSISGRDTFGWNWNGKYIDANLFLPTTSLFVPTTICHTCEVKRNQSLRESGGVLKILKFIPYLTPKPKYSYFKNNRFHFFFQEKWRFFCFFFKRTEQETRAVFFIVCAGVE